MTIKHNRENDMRKGLISVVAAGLIGVAALTISAAGFAASDAEKNALKYRQNVMKAIGINMGSIGAMLKGEVEFDANAVKAHAGAIQQLSRTIPVAFKMKTGDAGKTEALPEIWAEWSKFEAAAKTLDEEAGKMMEAAGSGDKGKIGAAMGGFGKNGCGGCHKVFRQKKG